MPTLYLVATPSALASCLQTAAPDDVVLLQNAAAQAASAEHDINQGSGQFSAPSSVRTSILGTVVPSGVSVRYLEADVVIDSASAPGAAVASCEPRVPADQWHSASVSSPLQPATMADFVALVLSCHPVVCWR